MLLKRVALALAGLLFAALLLLILLLQWRPSLSEWETFRPTASGPGTVEVRWLGAATLYVSDGKTHLITDGYFSRSPLWRLLFPIAPNEPRIDRALADAAIDRLDAVFVVHSHFDHAMDAPTVALRTGAELVGSESTANVGRGSALPPSRIRVVTPGQPLRYGDFEVTFLLSDHVPQNPWIDALSGMNENIDAPLVPPAPVSAWKEGESWALMIEHPAGNVLIQGSAGFREGQLQGRTADLAFISSVGLFRQPAGFVDDYVANTVGATGAPTVVPIHWDDFFRELEDDTPPLPKAMEDLNTSFALMQTAMARYDSRLVFLRPGDSLYLPLRATTSTGP